MTTSPAILAVCTGNICRSPAVELLLERALAPTSPGASTSAPLVASAGTHAVVGAPVDAQVAALLEADGVDHAAFRARQLTPALLRGPALVLTLTRGHRSIVVQNHPAALRRTFTVREFARLVASVEPGELDGVRTAVGPRARVEALVAAAQRARAQISETLAHDDLDIRDPYRESDAVHAQVYAQIVGELAGIARAVGG